MSHLSYSPLNPITQVAVEILQGKDPAELTQKNERSALLVAELVGSSEFCA